MSGFRDSLKGQYCRELSPGFLPIVSGRGWRGGEGMGGGEGMEWRGGDGVGGRGRAGPVGVGQLLEEEGEGKEGRREEGEKHRETQRPAALWASA